MAGNNRDEEGGIRATEASASAVGGEHARLAEELRGGRTTPALAAALIAWTVTVAPCGALDGVLLLVLAALAAGLGGPMLARRNVRAGRHVGITLFVALSVSVWLLEERVIHPLRLDPVRGMFGAVAWGAYALSWSDRWGPHAVGGSADPEGPLLLPRTALPAGATWITAVGVAGGLAMVALAFGVRDRERALVAQALALACAVGVVSASGVVATARGKRRMASERRITPALVRIFVLLAATAIAGAVLSTLR